MRRLIGWFVDSSTADEQELLHTSTLGPVYYRPMQGERHVINRVVQLGETEPLKPGTISTCKNITSW
jgi:hypothetical protein